MSQMRFSVIQNGAIVKIHDNQDGTTVCFMHPERAPDKTLNMAKVMANALNVAAERRAAPRQHRLA